MNSCPAQVLGSAHMSQYDLRGGGSNSKAESKKRVRRNSLTTLHSLPPERGSDDATPPPRQSTVPHGFNEAGLSTYFEETWIGERQRRHSIEREVGVQV